MYDKLLTIYIFMCGVASNSKSMDTDTDVDTDADAAVGIIMPSNIYRFQKVKKIFTPTITITR